MSTYKLNRCNTKYVRNLVFNSICVCVPDRVAQSVAHLTQKPDFPGSIPDPATYFRFSFRWFKKGSCQLPAKVNALICSTD